MLEGAVGLENYRETELPYSEGTWSAVVSAIGVTNVAITGKGEIFGNGTAWPQPKDYCGNQEGLRPWGVFFTDCKGIRLRDFTLRDAACWGVAAMPAKQSEAIRESIADFEYLSLFAERCGAEKAAKAVRHVLDNYPTGDPDWDNPAFTDEKRNLPDAMCGAILRQLTLQ